MNLYLISQDVNDGCDTYDSAVVVAESEEGAKIILPGLQDERYRVDFWAMPEHVKVKLIGHTDTEEAGTVICASFNAG